MIITIDARLANGPTQAPLAIPAGSRALATGSGAG